MQPIYGRRFFLYKYPYYVTKSENASNDDEREMLDGPYRPIHS